MTAEASVKGAILELPLCRINRLISAGKLDEKALSQHLSAEDIDLLGQSCHPTLWYPVEIHDRMMRVLCDCEGAGDMPTYGRRFGWSESDRMLEKGAIGALVERGSVFGNRAGVVLVKLADLAFNFGEWRYVGDNMTDFEVEGTDVEDLPESMRFALEGFISLLASRVSGSEVCTCSQRDVHDRVVFSTTLR
ncbi:MAG: hypothetical protein MJE66_22440 [Proteobacteria bacterium]|nr:hypothetical protein [Pseudomonadota bacterium]